jgi:hypothetical protein
MTITKANRRIIWNEEGTRCTVSPDWRHIKAGEKVNTGFDTITAPERVGNDPSYYTLYEEVYPNTNTHRCWVWMKECR